ncbi:MAG TPA: hypothetical protein DDZ81_12585 [Acetobacteraceae bacterium]|jgi:signal transduction histidine kinase/ActR/RegA family two-component response regulator|nr:hypothetical protein [Acetobacteraceae bacterium]
MKPDKHLVTAAGILIAAACLIVLTWVGTIRAIDAQRIESTNRVTVALSNQALTLTEQINRQILAIDQTLRNLVAAWEANPRGFELETARARSVVLNGLSRDMVMTDETGVIRQSSVVEAISQTAAGLDYFRALAESPDAGDGLYIGQAAIDGIMRQWHMNMARAMHYPDGSFAGVIDADYRIAAITDVFAQTDLGSNAFVALAGLEDGKLRCAFSTTTIDPDASISDTPMFAAIQTSDSGIWTGPSANDAVRRIHAFRHLPGRKLAVIVAVDEVEALRPAAEFRRQAQIFAGCISVLLVALALVLVQGMRVVRRRDAATVEDRAVLAASNAQLEVARALAAAKAEQLEATLSGMTHGVSMVDAHMCLVEWNTRFVEIAGVPAEVLRVGLPMEEVLRAQIQTGQFGAVRDPAAEVERRMAGLRTARFGIERRRLPDGRTLEIRRKRLPDGGFVTIYADITEQERTEEALRTARAAAATANGEKSRFAATVGHEIRTPLNALLKMIRLLNDSVLSPAQQPLVAMAQQSGDVLSGLINDILDMSRMEAGKLSIRPSLFELRPLLNTCVEMFQAQATQPGPTLRVSVADDTPATLLTDAGRLRQMLLNLLSNAAKDAPAGEVWLTAGPGHDSHEAIRLSVRDDGPVIAPESRTRMFSPPTPADHPEDEDAAGTGFGLSICDRLVTLMGGRIGYEVWRFEDGREGNIFWVTLPATVLPLRPGRGDTPGVHAPDPEPGASRLGRVAPLTELPPRALPRTRILLTEDVVANQLVTATLLRREGHHVDIASSGPAAIQAMKTGAYDLVFMDLVMPGLSGQETTGIIRELPEPARSTPIIALTANASAEDETAAKAAGMDGLLGKPVALTELLGALRTCVWETGAGTASEAGTAINGPGQAFATVLSAERINELRSNLPPAIFANLIEECLVDMDNRLPALRQAILAQAPGAIAAHSHAIVGMAAGYGMTALEARLRLVMNASREGDLSVLPPTIMTDIEHDFEEAAHSLRNILRTELA